MGPIPCYLQNYVVYACQSSSILFSGKSTIFDFLNIFFIEKGVWPYRYAYDIPMVMLILNIYGFVGPFQLYKGV